jgi:hypothetical protein
MVGSVGRSGLAEIQLPPARGGDAKTLGEGLGDQGRQRATMKTSPWAAFKVVAVFAPLTSLVADPTRLDRRGQRSKSSVSQLVFLLAEQFPTR